MHDDQVLIADGHLDLAFNALYHRRDLTQSVQVLREREGGRRDPSAAHPDSLDLRRAPHVAHQGPATVALPEMRQGRIGVALATIMCRVQVSHPQPPGAVRSPEAAYALGRSHLAYYQVLEQSGEITLIRCARDLEECRDRWLEEPDPSSSDRPKPLGFIVSMESADPILGPDQVEQWWDAGLRSVSLTHFGANTWGHGTGTRGGLYPNAYPLMDALHEAGVVLDVSHAADLAFRQLMDHWKGPVHASHAVCRALVPGQRHLSDDMITELAERGGVIGLVCAEQMLNPGWNWDQQSTARPNATRSLSALVEHVDHICQLTGSCEHVAIGSDLDGGFGRELAPIDLDTIADLQKIVPALRSRGYGDQDIEGIAHRNLIDFFLNAWS